MERGRTKEKEQQEKMEVVVVAVEGGRVDSSGGRGVPLDVDWTGRRWVGRRVSSMLLQAADRQGLAIFFLFFFTETLRMRFYPFRPAHGVCGWQRRWWAWGAVHGSVGWCVVCSSTSKQKQMQRSSALAAPPSVQLHTP